MERYDELMDLFEVHAVDELESFFDNGGNSNAKHNGKPLFTSLVEMYFRSPKFKECVKAFINHGLDFADQALLAVLSDDVEKLERELSLNTGIIHQKYSTFNNAFTSLDGATLLHYCAEYDHLNCGKLLLSQGADVNARAGYDENGFGGHTPIFHTVAQHNNSSLKMMQLLLDNGADLSVNLKGVIWGKGYEWETFIPSINPLSYAMMGLLPQIHRDQSQIAGNITLLLKYAYGIDYQVPNVPNRYLRR